MTTFPESIEEAIDEIIDNLNSVNLFEGEDAIDPTYVREEFGNFLFPQWKSGDEFRISFDDAERLIKRAAISESIDRLKDKGIIDTIVENGEEKFYLTGKANEYIKKRRS
jgi:hypothetical protein